MVPTVTLNPPVLHLLYCIIRMANVYLLPADVVHSRAAALVLHCIEPCLHKRKTPNGSRFVLINNESNIQLRQ